MRQFNFGECIPESLKVYNRLKKQGKNPKIVEGWVEVDYLDLEPCQKFLELYYPNDLKKLDKIFYYDNYIRVLPHTWVIYRNKIIDPTRNQFNKFGRIIRYYEKGRYWFKGKAPIKVYAMDLELGFCNEIWQDTNCIHYPEE